LADLPPPVLEVFYSPTCAPCRLELPVVADSLKHGGARIHIVILDQEERARRELRDVSVELEAAAEARYDSSPNAVLRAAGNPNGILPYARSMTASGAVCAKWAGGLTLARIRDMVAACARLISPG
jgi:thiol-disulfide isomerase/thioredoxin